MCPKNYKNKRLSKVFLGVTSTLLLILSFYLVDGFSEHYLNNNVMSVNKSLVYAKDYFPNTMGIKKSRYRFRRDRFFSTPTPAPVTTQTPIPTITPVIQPEIKSTNISWGAFVGWEPNDVIEFESQVDKKMDYVSLFVPWGDSNNFPYEMAEYALRNKKTLVIYWEARDENSTDVKDTKYGYDSILNGTWDNYINAFALHTKAAGTNIILIPFEEANGDWYPWSGSINNNSPQKHNEAYRYLRNKFSFNSNVKFGLALNNISIPDNEENSLENYYPGSDVVDYVGIDGFNFGNRWEDFGSIFEPAIIKLEKFDKPIIIFSTAAADSDLKADWISQIPSVLSKHPSVIGFSWFNENKEQDWRVCSNTQSLQAFKNILQ